MRIACISDLHYTSMRFRRRAKRDLNRAFYREFFRTFFSVEADLYVCLGDFTHFGTKRQLREVFSLIHETKRPEQQFEAVIGNHDVLFGRKQNFQDISGLDPLYRSIETEDLRLLFLDTARVAAFRKNSSIMAIDQSRWICDQLLTSGEKPTIAFAHHPCNNVRMTDSEGRYLTHMSLDAVLELKDGPGFYINGHKHKDCFYTSKNWAFLQLNDILDEPTIRVFDVQGGELSMHSVSIRTPWMLEASNDIARTLWTFVKTKNDTDFAEVNDLSLSVDETTDGFFVRMDIPSSASMGIS